MTSRTREEVIESIETLLMEKEFTDSQERSWARRRAVQHRRQFWTVFWAVLVLGCWVIVGLWALGVVQF